MTSQPEIRILPIPLDRDIHPGDKVADILLDTIAHLGLSLSAGDVLVIKHKIISKAEGQLVALDGIRPSAESLAWARKYHLDARVTEIALREAVRVVRRKNGVLITETRHGFVCANSGVDVSNVDGGQHALLLPRDPDRSAAQISRTVKKRLHLSVPVVITDTFGRPWREGLTEAAIGVSGMKAIHDDRGVQDPYGYSLRVSMEAVADELACAAGLVCGKLARTPACIIRGFTYKKAKGGSRQLVRRAEADLFR